MSDPIPDRFFDLAMMSIAGQSSNEELAELEKLMAEDENLKNEYNRLKAESELLKETIPLAEATQATEGEFPEWARANLQLEVKEVFGKPEVQPDQESHLQEAHPAMASLHQPEYAAEPMRKVSLWPRMLLGLGTVCALVALIDFMTPDMDGPKPGPSVAGKTPTAIIQVAMLDVNGPTRGTDTNVNKPKAKNRDHFEGQWLGLKVENFSDPIEFVDQWLEKWPESNEPRFKIYYVAHSRELKVVGKIGEETHEKTFPVEEDLPGTLAKAKAYVEEMTRAALENK